MFRGPSMNLFTCLFTLTYFQNWQILGMFKLSGVCYSLVSPLNASFFFVYSNGISIPSGILF